MKARPIAASFAAALFAAAVLPLLFILAESAVQWVPITADDFAFAYSLGAPFALAIALVVAWPSLGVLPKRWSLGRKMLAGALICFVVPVLAIWPTAGEFPWKGGVAGSATWFLWLAARRFIERAVSRAHSMRGEPSA